MREQKVTTSCDNEDVWLVKDCKELEARSLLKVNRPKRVNTFGSVRLAPSVVLARPFHPLPREDVELLL